MASSAESVAKEASSRGSGSRARAVCYPAPFALGLAALEANREPLVEPERHAPRRDAAHQRVSELVAQDALEFGGIGERPLDRYADFARHTRRPPKLRRLRDVMELLSRVEHDRDHFGRVGAVGAVPIRR